MRLEAFHDWESVAQLEREWDDLARDFGSDIYLSPAWCRVWWRHYGRGSLSILAVREERSSTPGSLVAVFPIFISRLWVGPTPLRVAKFLSSDSTIVVFSPPVRPDSLEECYRLAFAHLLGAEGCDIVSLAPLAGDTDPSAAIRRACDGPGSPGILLAERTLGVHTVFTLPESYEAYLNSLTPKFRSNLRRHLKGLGKNFELETRVVDDPAELQEQFPSFVAMHTKQWNADGMLGHFDDWPRARAFSDDLVRELAPLGRVALVCLTASGQPISYCWNFAFGHRAFWRLPARESGRDWDKHGLGSVGVVTMVEAMIARGLQSVESGPGHYEYKLQHGGEEFPLRSVLVRRRSMYARVVGRLAIAQSRALHLAYYRGWRGRVVGRLGWKYRPLWKGWIRTRL